MSFITGNGLPATMANSSSIDAPLYLFDQYYESINFINNIGNYCSLTAVLINITVLGMHAVGKLPRWTLFLFCLCFTNLCGALSLGKLQPFVQYKLSSNSYITEVYIMYSKIERPCLLFVYTLGIEEISHFVANLLVTCISVVLYQELKLMKRFTIKISKNINIVCLFCFFYLVCIQKYASIEVQTNVFSSPYLDEIQCYTSYNSTTVSKRNMYVSYLITDLILPIIISSLNFVLLCKIWKIYPKNDMKINNNYHCLHAWTNRSSSICNNAVHGETRGVMNQNYIKQILILITVSTVITLPISFLHLLVFITNKDSLFENNYSNMMLTTIIDKGAEHLYLFQTVVSEELVKNFNINLLFIVEVLVRFCKALNFMCTGEIGRAHV